MSEYKVPYTTIVNIIEHGNADSLEVAVVYGFNVIVRKGSYKVGDKVFYIPIDSIIPVELEDQLFGADAKIKLDKHRIRQIRIRKVPSQGMLVNPNEAFMKAKVPNPKLEQDYAEVLGISKYTPPEIGASYTAPGNRERKKVLYNPHFSQYGGIDNIKWFPTLFKEGEEVSITEKIHGTNSRAGIVPTAANTFWKRVKKFFGLLPKYEFVYGSNKVQLQYKEGNHQGFYGEDLWGRIFKEYNVQERLQPGEVIYGEIYGSGIQKNYNYGCSEGQQKLVLFDVKILVGTDGERYLDCDEFKTWCKERGFETCPELYRGPFNLELAKSLTVGDSVFCPSQKVREGVVVKSVKEEKCQIGRKMLKLISEAYLDDKTNTDFQ